MQYGPTYQKECPHCQGKFSEWTLASFNFLDADFWTDGKVVGSMYRESPRLVRCPHCNGYIWPEDLKELDESWEFGSNPKWVNTKPPIELETLADWLLALEQKPFDSKEKEKYARIRTWWCANDPFREDDAPSSETFNEAVRNNLGSLYDILSEKNDEERLMKAEIARETGSFQEAERLLKKPFMEEMENASSYIAELVRLRSTKVSRIPD